MPRNRFLAMKSELETMKQTPYRLTLSDKKKVQIDASNASGAIEKARWEYRGRTVIECHCGLTDEEAVEMRKITTKPVLAGFVSFEIPPHAPLTEDAVKSKRGRVIDTTEPMFDEAAIKMESERAKYAQTH